MKIETDVSPEALKAVRVLSRQKFKNPNVTLFTFLLLYSLPSIAILIFLHHYIALGIFLVLAIIYLCWILQENKQSYDRSFSPFTVAMTSDYLVLENKQMQGKFAWSVVHSIEEDANFIFVCLDSTAIFPLSKHSFSHSEQANKYIEMMQTFFQQNTQEDLKQKMTFDVVPRNTTDSPPLDGELEIHIENFRPYMTNVSILGFFPHISELFNLKTLFLIAAIVFLAVSLIRTPAINFVTVTEAILLSFLCFPVSFFLVNRINAIYHWIIQRKRNALTPSDAAAEIPITTNFKISPLGLIVRTQKMDLFFNWHAFYSVNETAEFIQFTQVMCQGVTNLRVIPTAAFDTPDEARRFVAKTLHYFEASRKKTEEEKATDVH